MPTGKVEAAVTPEVIQGGEPAPRGAASGSLSARPVLLAGLLLLFAGSGCAALIYEIVWFQMLQLVVGSTAVSLGGLLAAFMGGMCLGSLLLPRFMGPRANPLRTWALLELSIGALGLAVYFAVPWLGQVYAAAAPGGFAGLLLRGAFGTVCLLPPTLLMGATLPAVGRLAESTQKGASQLGLIYGANTLGAVVGALVAGFYLLRVGNMFTATCAAVGLNVVVGLVALSLRGPSAPNANEEIPVRPSPVGGLAGLPRWPVYAAIALSGLSALGAEVVWTRLLSLMLGGSTYTFSIILGVFLLGIGLGGGAGGLLARWVRSPRAALGGCQLLLMAAIAWSAWMLNRSLPYWPLNPSLARDMWVVFQVDFFRCLLAILPAACLWGASFPLALAATEAPGEDSSRLVGRLYAANTVGAIIGALAVSIWLVAWFGSQQTQRLLIVLSGVAAFLALWRRSEPACGEAPHAPESSSRSQPGGSRPGKPRLPRFAFGVAAVAAVLLAWSVPRVPWGLLAYGRYLPTKTELGAVLFQGEGMNSSVAVTELFNGVRNFHVSGKIEASTEPQDMRLQRMLAHIPALFHPDPRTVLVVGCGAGVTAGSFLTYPGVEQIRLCEIEPLIPQAVAHYFSVENYDVVHNSRVKITYDDARHYVLTSREKYDIITSDPIHPWVKGAATLYTREYFELCKQHLNPGGMVTQWVPLYESNREAVRSEIATFFEVFPEGTIWCNDNLGSGYDVVLLGQVQPLAVDLAKLQHRLDREDQRNAADALHEVGIQSGFNLVANYAGRARDLKAWLAPAQINRDGDLRLQYLAGLGLNLYESGPIFDEIAKFRQYPEDIFIGTNLWTEPLRLALQPTKSKTETPARTTTASTNSIPNRSGVL